MTAPDPATDLQQEIERTRERLGQAVEELAAKADVKAQARAKTAQMRARAQGKAMEAGAKARARAVEVSGRMRQGQVAERYWPYALTAVGVLVAGAALIWRRRTT